MCITCLQQNDICSFSLSSQCCVYMVLERKTVSSQFSTYRTGPLRVNLVIGCSLLDHGKMVSWCKCRGRKGDETHPSLLINSFLQPTKQQASHVWSGSASPGQIDTGRSVDCSLFSNVCVSRPCDRTSISPPPAVKDIPLSGIMRILVQLIQADFTTISTILQSRFTDALPNTSLITEILSSQVGWRGLKCWSDKAFICCSYIHWNDMVFAIYSISSGDR